MAAAARATIGRAITQLYGRAEVGSATDFPEAGYSFHAAASGAKKTQIIVSAGGPTENNDIDITVLDDDLTPRWRNRIAAATSPLKVAIPATCYDTSGNVYAGIDVEESTSMYAASIIKYNNLGARQWARRLNSASSVQSSSVCVDGSGNVFAVAAGVIVKYNSSGALQWQKAFSTMNISAMACDSSGNAYVAGTLSASTVSARLIKLDSSGALVWDRQITAAQLVTAIQSISVSPDGSKVAVVGDYSQSAGTSEAFIAVFDSSGTSVYSKSAWVSSYSIHSYNTMGFCTVNNDGSAILSFGHQRTTTHVVVVISFDSAGATVYSRAFTTSSFDVYACGICVEDGRYNINLAIIGATYGATLFALPLDGTIISSLTGGVGTITYGSVTTTVTNTAAWTTPTALTVVTGGLTDSASSIASDTSATYTFSSRRY